MGLASLEWLATLDKVGPAELAYVDFCEAAEYYAIILKQQHSCDFIIALTHMREPDDELLASKVTSVDLFLGGHDHIKCKKLVGGKWVLKSGSDFKVSFPILPLRHVSPLALSVWAFTTFQLLLKYKPHCWQERNVLRTKTEISVLTNSSYLCLYIRISLQLI